MFSTLKYFDNSYVFNDSILITFTSDDQERKHGFVLSYVERKYNATEEFQNPKSEKDVKTTHITNKYMTVHFPDLIQTLQ
jgi:hypothetical protein